MSSAAAAFIYEEKNDSILTESISSLAKYTIEHSNLKIFILHSRISFFTREKLLVHIPKTLEVEWIELPEMPLPEDQEPPPQLNAFLNLEKLIPQDLEILALLNGALFFRASIYELFHNKPNRIALARNKQDHFQSATPNSQSLWKTMDIDPQEPFYNPQVCLINLQYWKQEQLSSKLQNLWQKNQQNQFPLPLLFNLALRNNLEPLPEAWNSQWTYQELYESQHHPEQKKGLKLIQLTDLLLAKKSNIDLINLLT